MEDNLKNLTQREKVCYLLEEHRAQEERYKGLMADFINQKRNHEIEVENLKKTASKSTVMRILEFYDVFRIALKHNPKDKNLNILMDTYNKCMSRAGVEMFGEPGEKFNSDIHEAYSCQESTYNKGRIAEVLQKGCKLNGEIIRHAIVSVAQ